MGILGSIGKGKKRATTRGPKPASKHSSLPGAAAGTGPASREADANTRSRAKAPGVGAPQGSTRSRLPGKRRKGRSTSVRERVASAAAPLHDRRRRLVGARESTLRDLGGLMLEMYKRNRFREELLLDKCEEVLAVEVEIAHVDQRLFQLAPPNAAGMRPIGRCECGAPIHPGQNFCGVCGRSFATLTQSRSCARCGGGLRSGDQFCATCGTEAPDALQTIEAAPGMTARPATDPTTLAASAVAETMIIDAPPLDEDRSPQAELAVTPAEAAPPPIVPEPATRSAIPDLPIPAAAATSDAGFDWSAPPMAEDLAINAALESATSSVEPPPPVDEPIPLAPPAEIAPAGQVAAPSDTPSSGTLPAKAEAKLLAAERKAAAKAAKARAKQRASAAREARKRGGKS